MVVGPDDEKGIDGLVVVDAEVEDGVDGGLEAADGEGFLVVNGVFAGELDFGADAGAISAIAF